MSFKSWALSSICTVSAILGFQPLEATTSSHVFAKYPNKYFVESGSYRGGGIEMALQAGFQKVFSVELAPHLYEYCRERFASNPNVILFQGDSFKVLPLILKRIDAPATFWLDGHYSLGDTAKGETWTPLLKELDCIAKHPIKTHTILIDDIRECGTGNFDYITLDDIISKVRQINPNYVISFEDGYVANDVLVARVPLAQ